MRVTLRRVYDAGEQERRRLQLEIGSAVYNLPVVKVTQSGHTTVKVAGMPVLDWHEPSITTRLLDSETGLKFEVRSNQRDEPLSETDIGVNQSVVLQDNVITASATLTNKWNNGTIRTYVLSRALAASDFKFEKSGQMLNLKGASGNTIITSYQLDVDQSVNAPVFVNAAIVEAVLESPSDRLKFDWPGYAETKQVIVDVVALGGRPPAVVSESSQKVRLLTDESGDNICVVYKDSSGELSYVQTTARSLDVGGSATSRLGQVELGL